MAPGTLVDPDQNGWPAEQYCYITQSAATALGGPNGNGLPDDGLIASSPLGFPIQLAYRNDDDGLHAILLTSEQIAAHWRLDEAPGSAIAVDSSGNGLHGDYQGAVAGLPGARADSGTAADFDGSDDQIDVGSPAVLRMASGFSISAWINPDILIGYQRVFSQYTDGSTGYGFGLSGDELRFTTYGIKDYDTSGLDIPADKWTHVAVVFDSDNDARFYVNGSLAQTVAGNLPARVADTDFFIGSFGRGERFNGQIDDVMVFTGELSQGQVQEVMLGRYAPSAPVPEIQLTPVDQAHYGTLYLIGASGWGDAAVDVTLRYNDGTSGRASVTVDDWTSNIAQIEPGVLTLLDHMDTHSSGAWHNNNDRAIFAVPVPVDSSKVLVGIGLAGMGGGQACVLGVAGQAVSEFIVDESISTTHDIADALFYQPREGLQYLWTEGQEKTHIVTKTYRDRSFNLLGFDWDSLAKDEHLVDEKTYDRDAFPLLESEVLVAVWDYALPADTVVDLKPGQVVKDLDGSVYRYQGPATSAINLAVADFTDAGRWVPAIGNPAYVGDNAYTIQYEMIDDTDVELIPGVTIVKLVSGAFQGGVVGRRYRYVGVDTVDAVLSEQNYTASNWHDVTGSTTDAQVTYKSDYKNSTYSEQTTTWGGGWLRYKTVQLVKTWTSGKKDYYTHTLKADYPIRISFLEGPATPSINVASAEDLFLQDTVTAPSGGTVSITAEGDVVFDDAAAVLGVSPTIQAGGRVELSVEGSEGTVRSAEPVGGPGQGNPETLNITSQGDIEVRAVFDPLGNQSTRIVLGQVISLGGNVVLHAGDGIHAGDDSSLIIGNRIELNSGNGAIGSAALPLRIDSNLLGSGGLTAKAEGDIYIVEIEGDLKLTQPRAWDDAQASIHSEEGDVHLRVEAGAILDAFYEELEPRTEEETDELDRKMQLTGEAARAAAEASIRSEEGRQTELYHEYWLEYRDAGPSSVAREIPVDSLNAENDTIHFSEPHGLETGDEVFFTFGVDLTAEDFTDAGRWQAKPDYDVAALQSGELAEPQLGIAYDAVRGTIVVSWDTVGGAAYTLCRATAPGGPWTAVSGYEGIRGTGDPMAFEDADLGSAGFYRVETCELVDLQTGQIVRSDGVLYRYQGDDAQDVDLGSEDFGGAALWVEILPDHDLHADFEVPAGTVPLRPGQQVLDVDGRLYRYRGVDLSAEDFGDADRWAEITPDHDLESLTQGTLVDLHTDDLVRSAEGALHRYLGADSPDVDLSAEDFGDAAAWEIIPSYDLETPLPMVALQLGQVVRIVEDGASHHFHCLVDGVDLAAEDFSDPERWVEIAAAAGEPVGVSTGLLVRTADGELYQYAGDNAPETGLTEGLPYYAVVTATDDTSVKLAGTRYDAAVRESPEVADITVDITWDEALCKARLLVYNYSSGSLHDLQLTQVAGRLGPQGGNTIERSDGQGWDLDFALGQSVTVTAVTGGENLGTYLIEEIRDGGLTLALTDALFSRLQDVTVCDSEGQKLRHVHEGYGSADYDPNFVFRLTPEERQERIDDRTFSTESLSSPVAPALFEFLYPAAPSVGGGASGAENLNVLGRRVTMIAPAGKIGRVEAPVDILLAEGFGDLSEIERQTLAIAGPENIVSADYVVYRYKGDVGEVNLLKTDVTDTSLWQRQMPRYTTNGDTQREWVRDGDLVQVTIPHGRDGGPQFGVYRYQGQPGERDLSRQDYGDTETWFFLAQFDVAQGKQVLSSGSYVGRLEGVAVEAWNDVNVETADADGLRIEAQDAVSVAAPGALRIESITAGGPVRLTGASIVATSSGPLLVQCATATQGDIDLLVPETGRTDDDLTLAHGAVVSAANGSVTLRAGDDVILHGGSRVTAGTVLVVGDFGDADTGVGTTIQLLGDIDAAVTTVVASGDSDAVKLASVSEGGTMGVNAGGGDDNVSVEGELSGIKGLLTLHGEEGVDRLVVHDGDDSREGAGQAGQLEAGRISGLGMASGASIEYDGFETPQSGPGLTITLSPTSTATRSPYAAAVGSNGASPRCRQRQDHPGRRDPDRRDSWRNTGKRRQQQRR